MNEARIRRSRQTLAQLAESVWSATDVYRRRPQATLERARIQLLPQAVERFSPFPHATTKIENTILQDDWQPMDRQDITANEAD